MSGPNDLRDLVGGDVPEPELERLAEADAALRATPAPPVVPDSLTAAVLGIPQRRAGMNRRRLAAGLALAAAFAGAAFGIGVWVGGAPAPPIAATLTLAATANAPAGASMVLNVLPADGAGNWAMAGDVTGLPPLPRGSFYEVWMTKDGVLAVSCGRFITDVTGAARTVWLNAPYDFDGYDSWVVVAVRPGHAPGPILLDGPVAAPV